MGVLHCQSSTPVFYRQSPVLYRQSPVLYRQSPVLYSQSPVSATMTPVLVLLLTILSLSQGQEDPMDDLPDVDPIDDLPDDLPEDLPDDLPEDEPDVEELEMEAFDVCQNDEEEGLTWDEVKACEEMYGPMLIDQGITLPTEEDFHASDLNKDGILLFQEWEDWVEMVNGE